MPSVPLPLALFTALCTLGVNQPTPRAAPYYSTASIVNAADNQSGELAPNAIGTIYGTNLAYSTSALTSADIHGGLLPIMLGPSETTVFINHSPAALYYVSPTQINFLVPPDLLPGPATVYVVVDSWRGPIISLTLAPAAPGLFQLDVQNVIATRADGSVLTPSAPGLPGEVIVLWATGLGATSPPADGFHLPTSAAPLVATAEISVLLDGVALPRSAIFYAGVSPGFCGLYQINLTLPVSIHQNPEIRVKVDGALSVPQVHVPIVLN
jgi:uncharacterized protein (TIGR03437 family)